MTLFGGYLFGDSRYLFKDIGSDTLNYYFPQMLKLSEGRRHSFQEFLSGHGVEYDAIEHRRPELRITRPY
jgi:hypothetical protein